MARRRNCAVTFFRNARPVALLLSRRPALTHDVRATDVVKTALD